MAGLSDFFKVIQEEKKNQDKELHSLLGEEFSTDSFIDSLFSSAKEEIKKEKVIEEKITKIFDDIISNKNEAVVEEIVEEEEEEEDQIIEEEIVQESSQDESINQYIDFLKETVKNQPQEYQESLTNPSSKEIQDLKNLVWQVMRDVRAQGGGG
jgi:Asp-tRNA(Asn)/Glu-tRNA(Gln) amidotransferase B subunit